VVEDGQDPALLQMRDEPRALVERRGDDEEQVVGLLAVLGAGRRADAEAPGPRRELPSVALPYPATLRLDRGAGLELGVEERRQDVGRQRARAHVHPGVLVHQAPAHGAPIW